MLRPSLCVCACVCASLCAHTCSGGKRGGGGCLPVRDSEQRAGGLGMEQRICIDCFCASELFSHCQSCLHQLRGKLLHLHQEVFTFSFKKQNKKKHPPYMFFIYIISISLFSARNFEVFIKQCRDSCDAFPVSANELLAALLYFVLYN